MSDANEQSIDTTSFSGNLDESADSLQALARAVDNLTPAPSTHAATAITTPASADEFGLWNSVTEAWAKITWANLKVNLNGLYAALLASTAANDFQVGNGSGGWIKKTLAEVKTILGLGSAAYTASADYAVAAKGVTNGDSHDHSGGDGAQVAHTALSSIGTNTHAQIDTFIATTAPATYAPIAKGVTGGDAHNHSGGDGAQIAHTALSSIGTNTHAQIDTFIATTAPATYAPIAKGVTSGDAHNHNGGDGAQIAHTALSSIGTNTHAQIDTFMSTILSGSFTPTLTNVTNLAASTAFVCYYMQVDNMVTVSGKVNMDPAAVGAIELGMSLPIASAFSSQQQCGGTAVCAAVAQACAIFADATNDRASFQGIVSDITNKAWAFSFTYRII